MSDYNAERVLVRYPGGANLNAPPGAEGVLIGNQEGFGAG